MLNRHRLTIGPRPLLDDTDARKIVREIDETAIWYGTSLHVAGKKHIVYAHDRRTQTKTEIRSRADWEKLRDSRQGGRP